MGWRDELRTASFKGIMFYVADHEATYGRRTTTHEYPYRDMPFTEDMGRTARRWNITAYLLGENYMAARDALLDAVESGGPGQLIHPYLGTKKVVATEARSRETQRDGGYVEIAISFVEAGEKTFPNGAPLPSKLVGMNADSLISVSKGIFESGINLSGVQEFVRDSYAGNISSAGAIFQNIQQLGGLNSIGAIAGIVGSTAKINQSAEWAVSLAEILNPSTSLVSDVSGMAARVISLFKGVFDLAAGPRESLKNLSRFNDYSADHSSVSTAQTEILNSNSDATERFIRTVSTANEAKAMVDLDFQSYDEAIESRKYILNQIDDLALHSNDDLEYSALQSLRENIAAAIPAPDQSLPVISSIELRQSSPALAVSYDLYETVERADDIVNRNSVRHPGFVPGGVELKVLIDA